jgi:hypothetical protein
MGRLACALLAVTLALLTGAAAASSQPQAHNGEVWVGLKGWGSGKLGRGAPEHRTVRCARQSCPAVNYLTRGSRVVISERPSEGWKFTHWHGACKGKRPR